MTPAVLDAFYAHHCVLHNKQYPADNAVGQPSLCLNIAIRRPAHRGRAGLAVGGCWCKTDNPDTPPPRLPAIGTKLHPTG